MCSFEKKNHFCCFNSETKHSGLVIFSCTCMACGTERMRPVEMCCAACASSFRARARPKGYHHRGGVCGGWFIFAVYPCCWARETRRGSIQKRGHQKLWPVHPYHSWPAGRPVGMGARPRRRRFVGRQQQANHQPRTNPSRPPPLAFPLIPRPWVAVADGPMTTKPAMRCGLEQLRTEATLGPANRHWAHGRYRYVIPTNKATSRPRSVMLVAQEVVSH